MPAKKKPTNYKNLFYEQKNITARCNQTIDNLSNLHNEGVAKIIKLEKDLTESQHQNSVKDLQIGTFENEVAELKQRMGNKATEILLMQNKINELEASIFNMSIALARLSR